MLWSMFHFTGKVEIMLVIRMKNNTDKGDSNNSDTEDSSANTIIKDLNIGANSVS